MGEGTLLLWRGHREHILMPYLVCAVEMAYPDILI